MRNKLENSHQLTLELEEKVRKAGQTDSSLVEMMKKVREASEAELRRFMEETEAKYNLNVRYFYVNVAETLYASKRAMLSYNTNELGSICCLIVIIYHTCRIYHLT